jgi:Hsp33 protein
MERPYTGMVPITSGEVAEDLARYMVESEQTNSAIGLGVSVNRDASIRAAGGFLIQVHVCLSTDAAGFLSCDTKNAARVWADRVAPQPSTTRSYVWLPNMDKKTDLHAKQDRCFLLLNGALCTSIYLSGTGTVPWMKSAGHPPPKKTSTCVGRQRGPNVLSCVPNRDQMSYHVCRAALHLRPAARWCFPSAATTSQVLPFASDETLEQLEANLSSVSSVTALLHEGLDARGIAQRLLAGLGETDTGFTLTPRWRRAAAIRGGSIADLESRHWAGLAWSPTGRN